MKKKMIFKRISAFLCAMIIGISAFIGVHPYKAEVDSNVEGVLAELGISLPSKYVQGYSYALWYIPDVNCYYLLGYDPLNAVVTGIEANEQIDSAISSVQFKGLFYTFTPTISNAGKYNFFKGYYQCSTKTWKMNKHTSTDDVGAASFNCRAYSCNYSSIDDEFAKSELTANLLYSDFLGGFQLNDSYLIDKLGWAQFTIYPPGASEYDKDIGYLQNINRLLLYPTGKYTYYYNEDKLTVRWKFDTTTTTGLDLSSGNYSIKHYVRPVLVDGYHDSEVIEKYDKYYVGTYDPSPGYIEYLDKDLTANLESQGYEGIGFVDAYIKGYFILQWHYFEVIDNETGASGGYVCLKPKDADGTNFGTEYQVIAVDEDDNKIDGYEEDVAYTGEGTYITSDGETLDDAAEEAEEDVTEQEEGTNFINLKGTALFASVMSSLANSTSNFAAVISNFFGCLPDWVLMVFGLSVALTFLMFIIKNLR